MDVEFKSEGGVYYRVYADGKFISKHSTQHRAHEKARAVEIANPEKDVYYTIESKILAEADVAINITTTPETGAELSAFPGAYGHAAKITGGRGGQVIKVTNGNSSGAGSLQAALDVQGARIIVFEYSGVIDTDGPRHEIVVKHGDVTIAGQTAPGAGITINGRLVGKYDFSVGNIITRYLRVRPPNLTAAMIAGNQWDSVQFSRNPKVLLDHCSIAGGVDENLDMYEADNITLINCMIENPLSSSLHPDGVNHYYGSINGPNSKRISILNNIYANLKRRAPAIASGPSETINNVMYNTQASWQFQNPAAGVHSIINNYFKDGPDESIVPVFLDAESVGAGLGIYDSGNYVDDPGDHVGEFSIFDNGANHSSTAISSLCGAFSGGACTDYELTTKPVFTGDYYIEPPVLTAQEAYNEAINKAGCFPRDALSLEVISNIQNRTGNGGGNYVQPADLMAGLTVGTAPVDSNNDGLPDDWSIENGFDPSGPNISQVVMPDGYPAIESYINDLAEALVNNPVAPAVASIGFQVVSANINENQGSYKISIIKTGDPSISVSAKLNSSNGTAIAGTHYNALTDVTITIPAGQNSASQNITIIDNATEDGNVAFTLTLTNPTGGTLSANASQTVNISDDEAGFQPIMTDALISQLAGYGTSNPQYVEMMAELTPWVTGGKTPNDYRRMFNHGGIVNPLVVFGEAALPSGWAAATKAALLDAITTFPTTNRNTIRLTGGDVFHAAIIVADKLPTLFSSTEWNNQILPGLEDIADHLWDEHTPNGTGKFLVSDSDETNSWTEIAFLAPQILPTGNAKTHMNTMWPNLLAWFRDRVILKDGTYSGGCSLEATGYIGQNCRYPIRMAHMFPRAGHALNTGENWNEEAALHHALMWLSDESGIWAYHDGIGIQSHRDSQTYPVNWKTGMSVNSEKTERWTSSPMLGSKGAPAHEALCYLMDHVIPAADNAGSRSSKVANWLFRDDQASPTSLAAIPNLPTSHNPGKRSIYCARKNWQLNAPQFFFNKTQFRQQDHCQIAAYFEFWEDGVPISHGSTSTSTHTKKSMVSTMMIESFAGSTSQPEYFPFDAYPGAQGARSVRYGEDDHGDFIPYGPVDILDSSDSVAANVVTENGQRYWDDSLSMTGGGTKFLKVWNKTGRVEWDGLAFIYDYISMDVTDFSDIVRRYTNHPEAGRNPVGKSHWNRKATRTTKTTAMPVTNVSTGWLGWTEHGKQGYYKPISHQAPTIRIVNEKTEEPWASYNHYSMWPIQKNAHIQESLELSNTSGFDNMDFMALLAWGNTGEAEPVSYTANNPGASANHYGAAALHKGIKKVFITTRNPSNHISATISLTFPGLAPGALTQIAVLNIDPSQNWSASVSGDTITIIPGSGISPNASGILEITLS